jgi:hypothetical protein
MILKNEREVEETRRKLRILEDRLEESRTEIPSNPVTHELSQRSLTRMINQMKEEIARFKAHAAHK